MIYVVGWALNMPLKVGHSIDPHKRLSELQVGCPFELRILATGKVMRTFYSKHWNSKSIERAIHKQLKDKRLRGEWFDVELSEVTALFPKVPGRDGHVEWTVAS